MFLQYKNHRIHYKKFGNGQKLLIVFHGFGDSAELFLNLKESLEERYTVVALDAPFHGETEWNSGIFYPNDLKNIVNLIRANFEHERFSIMAHSMGGLLVMGIFKYFAKYVDELILLAPAGLQDSVIYNKILFNLPVRQLFKWTSNKPKFSSKLLEMSKKYGWLDRLTHVFFSRQLGDDKLRKRMFNTWASLFFFPRRLSQFRRLIRKYNIELLIYYGQRDSLTPVSAGKKFADRLQRKKKTTNVEIKLVNDGHFFIRGPLNEALKEKFKENQSNDDFEKDIKK